MSKDFVTISDARKRARKRLPRMVFDFIDGAAGDESAMRRNTEALDAIQLRPRVLRDISQIDLGTTFLGRRWKAPFGIAPMGMCNLAWPGTDRGFAAAATSSGIPLVLSTASSTSIEVMSRHAVDNLWFQLYVGQSEAQAMQLVDRAEAAACQVLVLTVDAQRVGVRPRDKRNGFQAPLKLGPKQFLDFALHPRWSLESLRAGIPRTANFSSDTGENSFQRDQARGCVDSAFLHRLRARWSGKLVVKGVLCEQDARAIAAAGVDAIWVSNHGGRQLNSAPAAIACLPSIRAAVGATYPLIFDSGVRSGECVVKALAQGADFVMLGRPFLYGAGASGKNGASRVAAILTEDIEQALAQLGCASVQSLGPDHLYNG